MKESFLKQCRICLETEGELITPCNCKGTIKYVHRECLQKWRTTLPINVFNNKRDIQCEVCHKYYEFENLYEDKNYKLPEYIIIFLETVTCIILLHCFGFLLGVLVTWFGKLSSMIFINNINIYLYQYLLGNVILHIITGLIVLFYTLNQNVIDENEDTINNDSCFCVNFIFSECECFCILFCLILNAIFITFLGIYYWVLKRSKKRQSINNDNRIVRNLEIEFII